MRIKEHPILEFNQKEKVKFTLDGKKLEGYKGEPIASALVAAGIKVLSRSIKYHRPRGFFCPRNKFKILIDFRNYRFFYTIRTVHFF